MTPEETARIKWNESRKNIPDLRLADDLWMEDYKQLITDSEGPVIDLGCGGGYDTEILLEWGMNVISCDYSDVAINNMRNSYKDKYGDKWKALCFDMTGPFPFEDSFTDLMIADLSLHYFTEENTRKIIKEIFRVLKPGGILLMRVNTPEDTSYGSDSGEEIEPGLRKLSDGRLKRFFNNDDIKRFFTGFDIEEIRKGSMCRYGPEKKLLIAKIKKGISV